MAANLTVRADVIDISNDHPLAGEKFLVDTNVWYWLTYSRASLSSNAPRPYQTSLYPEYINNALDNGSIIFQSQLSIAELTHLIEKNEREIFEATQRRSISPKIYRHDHPDERANVVSQLDAVCAQVFSLSDPLSSTLDLETSKSALERVKSECVDGYDLFILESMERSNILQVLTDDGDFSTVEGITVFTANRNVINAAKIQGKLVER